MISWSVNKGTPFFFFFFFFFFVFFRDGNLPKHRVPFHLRFPRLAQRHASNDMSALHHRLRLLGRVLLALQACLLAARAAVVEIDMIFPRNDTYDPGPLMPVVFAIRNSAIAASLNLAILWSITDQADTTNTNGYSGVIDLKHTNLTGTDPFFVADYALRINGTERGWVMSWGLSFDNCSRNSLNPNAPTIAQNSEDRHHLFSTKPGAPAPNLVQGPGSCVNSTGVAINIAETLPLDLYHLNNGHDSCHVLASPPMVAASPCAVTVDNATAATILGIYCGPDTATTCPPKSGAAAQRAPILVAWFLPVLAGLVLYVAV